MWCYIVVQRGTANTLKARGSREKTVALPTLCGIVPPRTKSLVDYKKSQSSNPVAILRHKDTSFVSSHSSIE